VDRVFLDANVLFSAAYRPDSGLLKLWHLPQVQIVTSEYAAEEARINLDDESQQARLARLLTNVEVVASIMDILPEDIELPAKDRPILAAACQARATHLLTEIKNILPLLWPKGWGCPHFAASRIPQASPPLISQPPAPGWLQPSLRNRQLESPQVPKPRPALPHADRVC
jgi:predicted nucleic acid-binding protein